MGTRIVFHAGLAKSGHSRHLLATVLINRAIFLDRDDTLMVNVPYLGDPSKVQIFPEAPEALRSLQEAGFLLIIVSNQSGVGRGLITVAQMESVNQELVRQLSPVSMTAFYQSLSAPTDETAAFDRKPAPGLLFRAQAEHHLDLSRSYFIGDRLSDIQCAINGGCTPILVKHPLATIEHDPADDAEAERLATLTVSNLTEAATWIISLQRADFSEDSLLPPSPLDIFS